MFLLALSAAMFVAHSMGKYTEYLFPAEHPRQMGFKSSAMQVMQIGPLALQSHGVTPVFDPTYAKRERKTVLSKYVAASNILKGIGLNPMERIQFAENFPAFDDPFNVTKVVTYINQPGALIQQVPVMTKLPLTDHVAGGEDIMYFGDLLFGLNKQKLSIDLDTGSADLWVVSNCTGCEGDQFDMGSSLKLRKLDEGFSISYGIGEASGILVNDTINIAGIPVENQTFGAVNYVSEDLKGYPNRGILGLAFASISSSGSRTVFDNLMANGQVAAPFFAVHLTRNQVKGSEVCMGCYDPMKTKGPVSWIPVKSKTYWSVHMNGLRHNSSGILETDLIAAIDTGTTLIYVPDRVASDFYQRIPGAKSCKQIGPGFFSYPCGTKLDIALAFGGKEFAISPYDFNLGKLSADSTDCVGGILSLGDDFPDTIAIVGDEFLKSWYSVYDYSNGARVGFAPSINN